MRPCRCPGLCRRFPARLTSWPPAYGWCWPARTWPRAPGSSWPTSATLFCRRSFRLPPSPRCCWPPRWPQKPRPPGACHAETTRAGTERRLPRSLERETTTGDRSVVTTTRISAAALHMSLFTGPIAGCPLGVSSGYCSGPRGAGKGGHSGTGSLCIPATACRFLRQGYRARSDNPPGLIAQDRRPEIHSCRISRGVPGQRPGGVPRSHLTLRVRHQGRRCPGRRPCGMT